MKPLLLGLLALMSAISTGAAELRISAAASLSEAMTEIAALYGKTHGEKPQLNFGGSNALARQPPRLWPMRAGPQPPEP